MFLLHALQSPINVGMILRSAEAFGQSVVICDTHNVMGDENLSVVADFACGALGRRPPAVEVDLDACLARVKGRLIATGFGDNAVPLTYSKWLNDDCIIFGNEYDGLPGSVLGRADMTIWVPLPSQHLPKPISANPIDPARSASVRNNGQPSLNVAATAAIIAHDVYAARIISLKPK